eukprot:TRINITY_DN10594_c0_g2_i1.p1 TRINITY_DN10594_c0_g2~~TRINITY_DN10594_c0_g2_i1.p1  ORF type:complete len:779 (-),score=33.16 TRINITY_DN10594_c0_g2_i1:110-2446(-)
MCNLLGLLFCFVLRLVRSSRVTLTIACGVLTSLDVLSAERRSLSEPNATEPSSTSSMHVERKPYDRDCAVEDCDGGQAWSFRIYYAFTSNALKKRPFVINRFHKAIEMITEHVPCIEFVALDGSSGEQRSYEKSDFEERAYTRSPLEGVILVDSKKPKDCYTLGLGFPGVYGMRYMSLGDCASEGGSAAHELLHALGVTHEMKRLNGSEQFDGYGPHIKLGEISFDEMRQFASNKSAYMGSRAVGGYVAFDFDSLMMYDAGTRFHTLPNGEHDHRTRVLQQLSKGDIEQLKDMYGCLKPRGWVCSTTAASREVDQDGDCSCPLGSKCYKGKKQDCPSSKFAKSPEYFHARCATCRCQAMECPSSSSDRLPNSGGDCACPKDFWCMQDGRPGCASSRSGRDLEYMHSTCKTCRCIPQTCNQSSQTDWLLPNDEGDCECRSGYSCYNEEAGTLGCPLTNGGIGLRFFSSTCSRCVCVLSEAIRTCPREATSKHPDSEGDCTCMSGTKCRYLADKKADKKDDNSTLCPYSGGLSDMYFSAACRDCQCVEPEEYSRRETFRYYGRLVTFMPYRPVDIKHPDCNTKCGAKRAMLGPFEWNLHGSGFEDRSCGQCHAIEISRNPNAVCQDYGYSAEYEILGFHTRHILCCRRLDCTHEEESCEKRGRVCEEHAQCLSEDSTKPSNRLVCKCDDGYEETPHRVRDDRRKCSPVKPAGARCCHLNNVYFMWVPKEHLERQKFQMKYTCPEIRGQKWKHADDDLCEKKDRFVYEGLLETPASKSGRW